MCTALQNMHCQRSCRHSISRESCRCGREAAFLSLVGSGNPQEITAHMFVHWVYRSVVSERSEYRHYLRDWWLIFWGEFINLTSNFFLWRTKYVLISANRSNSAITIHDRFPVLSTLSLHRVAAISIITFGKWEGESLRHLSRKIGKDAAKIRGEIPCLNDCKLFWKN